MSENSVWNDNYFFRDYVTEDISSIGIGPVWIYFFKETLIGVRDLEMKEAWFAVVDTVKTFKANYVPTIEQLTSEHIKEAIDEIDRQGETIKYLDLPEVMQKAKEIALREFGREMDAKLTGTTRQTY